MNQASNVDGTYNQLCDPINYPLFDGTQTKLGFQV